MLARTVARRTLTSVGATRSFNKSTMNRGGAAGGHGEGHGHDDHHPHPMWSSLPFNKGTTAVICCFVLFGGVGVITTAVVHQHSIQGVVFGSLMYRNSYSMAAADGADPPSKSSGYSDIPPSCSASAEK